MHKNKINILFICPYPIGQSPSQRFRFEQYFHSLQIHGFLLEVRPFLTLSAWQILYERGNLLRKVTGVLRGFIDRLITIPSVWNFDFVFIHREATPIGPPWFEWVISKVLQKKIIYDFDDAIWLPTISEENKLISKLKWHSKVKSICKWSHVVSCGNKYLYDYAKQFSANVVLNPTTIDSDNLHNPALYAQGLKSNKLTIGWTGSHSTLKYLDLILPALQSIEKKFSDQLRFVIIADKKPSFVLSSLHFVKWSKETEIQDLLQFDIGLMPLPDDVWAKGKCGFKALQYLALEIPTLASPVGVNCAIIDNGINGFLCGSLGQWVENTEKLINDIELRKKMGIHGREKIKNHYSVASNLFNFLSIFE